MMSNIVETSANLSAVQVLLDAVVLFPSVV